MTEEHTPTQAMSEDEARRILAEHCCDEQAKRVRKNAPTVCEFTDRLTRAILTAAAKARAEAIEEQDGLRKALAMLRDYGCPVCAGDCSSANPLVSFCPMQEVDAALKGCRP